MFTGLIQAQKQAERDVNIVHPLRLSSHIKGPELSFFCCYHFVQHKSVLSSLLIADMPSQEVEMIKGGTEETTW